VNIRYEVDGGVATIARRLHRRGVRAADDEATRVVITTGAGGASCAGTDLCELDETPEDQRGSAARRDDERSRRPWPIVQCPKPVIAAIDGAAVGMGVEFATQADVRIASDRAKLGWIFVKRGLVPDTGAGSFLLPRQVGATEALRLLLSGEVIDADEALRIGFVSQVVPPEELLAVARAEAERYLDYWPAFHAWRSGCIAAGVYTRYKAGQMGDTADDLVRFEDSVEHSIHVGLVAAGIA